MKIIHKLTRENNYSYFLNCPLCGAEFKNIKRIKLIEEDKNKRIKLLENKATIIAALPLNRNRVYSFSCSECMFSVNYYFEEIETERKIN